MRLTGTPGWLAGRRKRAAEQERREEVRKAPPGPARLWAVGGGKGGIGKSFLAVNLAAVAARMGQSVILIDADLGGANLHTCLGVKVGQRVNLSDWLEDRVVDLEKMAQDTPVPGLRLILGALGTAQQAETTWEQRVQLLRAIRRLPADLVIIDLAAGVDKATIDFFVASDDGFLVTTPEPTAVENAYQFLRASFYRRLHAALQQTHAGDVVREAMRARGKRGERGVQTPADLLREIERAAPAEATRVREVLDRFRPHLVVNQVQEGEEVKMGFSIRSVCRKFFGIEVDYLGYINFDEHARRSIKERRPLVLAYPQSDGARYVRRIVKKLLGG